MARWVVSSAWVMAVMICPEALTLNGQLAGLNGIYFVIPLAAAAGLHWLSSQGMKGPGKNSGPEDEIALLTGVFGNFGGSLILWLARPAAGIALVTATLVTAGFVFNETFVYWFPNFAFAAILLVVVSGINLAGPRVAAYAQVGFTATAVTGLLSLVIMAAFAGERSPAFTVNGEAGGSGHGILTAAFLFIGYDLLRYAVPERGPRQLTGRMGAGIILAGVVLFLWNGVSVYFVAPERLAGSSIPHILTAKAVAGQTGRILIAIVGIAGTCALVNLIFRATARMMTAMAALQLLPRNLVRHGDRPVISLAGLAGIVGMSMVTGLAGSEKLEVLIRAGLILWIGFYAVVHLARWLTRRGRNDALPPAPKTGPTLNLICCLAMTGTAAGLVFQYQQPAALAAMMLTIAMPAAAVAWIGPRWPQRRKIDVNQLVT